MPTDFAMKWLCFFGRLSLLWGGVEEPARNDRQHLYLAPLGFACLLAGVLLTLPILAINPKLVAQIAELRSGTFNSATFAALFDVVAVAGLVLASPWMVGHVYNLHLLLRRRFLLLALAAAAVGPSLVALAVKWQAPSFLSVILIPISIISWIPLVLMLCPLLPDNPVTVSAVADGQATPPAQGPLAAGENIKTPPHGQPSTKARRRETNV